MYKKVSIILWISSSLSMFLGLANAQNTNADMTKKDNSKVDSEQVTNAIKKVDALEKQLEQLNIKVDGLANTLDKTTKTKETKPLTPQDIQAQSSSIFVPGGAPRPVTHTQRPPLKSTKKAPPATKAPTKGTDSPDKQSGQETLSDDSSSDSLSSNNYNSGYDYDNSGGYYPSTPQTNRKVTFSLNNYTSGTYTYDSSSSTVSFDFVDNITLTLDFNNFSVYNLKICNSSYQNCISVDAVDTNEYQLATAQLNTVSPNLGANQVSLTGGTFFVPTFYVTYTATSDSSTTLEGSFSFPTSSDDVECSENANTVSCQLTQSAQVNFSLTS